MIERSPLLDALTHALMIVGLIVTAFPIYVVFIASTHDLPSVNQVPMSLIPGNHLVENYAKVWSKSDFGAKMLNSLIVAVGVTVGKVILAAISAFSIVFFRYRLRMVFFWMIFITLMLPLEVRIVPTYAVAADVAEPLRWLVWLFGIELALPPVNLLNSYTGLILPLIATATGTFLYRQFFLTIPDSLVEAAKMDGAGPVRFFIEHLLPLSRNNMAALATIMFVYAWNQYLWPLLITTEQSMATATMQLQKIVPGPLFGQPPIWNEAMAATLMVMVPPLLVVIFMQHYFVRGLIASDK
ncbi:sn-glycerol-3-phosphate ABC transporter permease UgpE [Rhabdaerophilum calidifontis]|uniref:sn-glycerol-3-phosphate ABC transporter permease UgpE n=1 Tax=Rhabdaerophilum calidifontis TaxID=2604328 RepID=UPI0012386BEE|nr:sn-glycerol-3-phosphate ABC transporter permease UgpE [Rhabdaerophilum calidifontis]